MEKTTKLNYYYVPKKSQYKLTIVEPVEPIAIDNDFMIDLLLFNIGTTRALCCGVNGTTK